MQFHQGSKLKKIIDNSPFAVNFYDSVAEMEKDGWVYMSEFV